MEERDFLPTDGLDVAYDVAEDIADGGTKQCQDHNNDDSN
jgi:hypothetical protein